MQNESGWALITEDFAPIAEFSSIVETTFSLDSRVVSAPIEQGSFTSYNKTESPNTVGFRAMLAGDNEQQEETLVKLQELKNSTELLRLLTPFESFEGLNLVTLKWERTADLGSTRTLVDLSLQEIKQTTVISKRMSSPKQVKNAGSVSNVKTGRVASEPVSPNVISRIESKYPKNYEIGDDK